MSNQRRLRNGLLEIEVHNIHRLPVLGSQVVTLASEDTEKRSLPKRQLLLTWDEKNAFLCDIDRVVRSLKFGPTKESQLNCMTFVTATKVFIGASLAMTFRVYDYRMKVVEVIAHKERMITSMQYDAIRDVIVMNGSGGTTRKHLGYVTFIIFIKSETFL